MSRDIQRLIREVEVKNLVKWARWQSPQDLGNSRHGGLCVSLPHLWELFLSNIEPVHGGVASSNDPKLGAARC
jgi:hypothetical protein